MRALAQLVGVAVGWHLVFVQGGPCEPPEGLETLGCPVYSHPAQLTDNRNVSEAHASCIKKIS